MGSVQASLLAIAILVAAAFATAAGTTYTVGEPGGSWDLQTNLTSWVSSIDFRTGDNLVFKYSSAAHNVVEVTETGYRSCSAASPVATFRTGNDAIQLAGVGTRYFICGVPGHCTAGMKLKVRVQPARSCRSRRRQRRSTGRRGGLCKEDNLPPTVIVSPSSDGAASGPLGSVSSVVVMTVLLMLWLLF